jgi:hypothetical protein
VVAALAPGAGDKAEAGTSTKLGWEQGAVARPAGSFTPARIAMVVTPLIAIAGVLAWKLAGSSDAPGEPNQTVDRVTPGPATTTKPADPTAEVIAPTTATTTTTTKPADPTAEVIAPTTAPTAPPPVDAKAATATAAAARSVDPRAVGTAAAKPVDPKATAAAAKPVDPKAVGTAATKPVDPKAVGTAATKPVDPKAAAATPAGPAGDAPIATLAPGVVEQLASRNRKALLACEAGESLQGDLTIRFQINAEGQVVRSAAQSTLGKPKVSNCILLTLRGWRFPKPATGAAAGVYSISFQ